MLFLGGNKTFKILKWAAGREWLTSHLHITQNKTKAVFIPCSQIKIHLLDDPNETMILKISSTHRSHHLMLSSAHLPWVLPKTQTCTDSKKLMQMHIFKQQNQCVIIKRVLVYRRLLVFEMWFIFSTASWKLYSILLGFF